MQNSYCHCFSILAKFFCNWTRPFWYSMLCRLWRFLISYLIIFIVLYISHFHIEKLLYAVVLFLTFSFSFFLFFHGSSIRNPRLRHCAVSYGYFWRDPNYFVQVSFFHHIKYQFVSYIATSHGLSCLGCYNGDMSSHFT